MPASYIAKAQRAVEVPSNWRSRATKAKTRIEGYHVVGSGGFGARARKPRAVYTWEELLEPDMPAEYDKPRIRTRAELYGCAPITRWPRLLRFMNQAFDQSGYFVVAVWVWMFVACFL